MKNYISAEKKIAMILELLLSLGCSVLSMDFEKDTLDLSVTVTGDHGESDNEDDGDDEACPYFETDEDDEDAEVDHCIHCCPECGSCMIGMDGEDC